MMRNNKIRSRHGYKSFDRDTFYGWMCWCDEEPRFFTARNECEAASMASRRNKLKNPRSSKALYGNSWHMVHYIPGEHWAMPDILSKKERFGCEFGHTLDGLIKQ